MNTLLETGDMTREEAAKKYSMAENGRNAANKIKNI